MKLVHFDFIYFQFNILAHVDLTPLSAGCTCHRSNLRYTYIWQSTRSYRACKLFVTASSLTRPVLFFFTFAVSNSLITVC
jgi:hypothetical protein